VGASGGPGAPLASRQAVRALELATRWFHEAAVVASAATGDSGVVGRASAARATVASWRADEDYAIAHLRHVALVLARSVAAGPGGAVGTPVGLRSASSAPCSAQLYSRAFVRRVLRGVTLASALRPRFRVSSRAGASVLDVSSCCAATASTNGRHARRVLVSPFHDWHHCLLSRRFRAALEAGSYAAAVRRGAAVSRGGVRSAAAGEDDAAVG
jgi:hypothetical protein